MILCPLSSPCRITQHFGERPPVYGPGGHNGIDLAGPKAGVPVRVYSPFDAVVYQIVKASSGYGLHVILRTAEQGGRRRQVILGHFSKVSVKQGEQLPLGGLIGVSGKSGFTDGGIHLHLCMQFIDTQGNVLDADNGHQGWIDVEPYMLFWKPTGPDMVSFS